MAREFGDNDAGGAESRKRSKGEQGQHCDAHLAENISTPAVRQSQDNGVPSQSHDLDTYLNARTPVETARLMGEAAPQRAVVLLRL